MSFDQAINSFKPNNGLDVVGNVVVTNSSWSSEGLKRVVEYLNSNPISSTLNLESVNDILNSVHIYTLSYSIFTRSTIQKVEFELFKSFVRPFFPYSLTDPELKLLYKFTIELKTCSIHELQLMGQIYSKDELFELLEQIHNIIKPNESLVDHLNTLESVLPSDRDKVIAFMTVLDIINTKERLAFLKIVSLIPEDQRNTNQIRKFLSLAKSLPILDFKPLVSLFERTSQDKRLEIISNFIYLNSVKPNIKFDETNFVVLLESISGLSNQTLFIVTLKVQWIHALKILSDLKNTPKIDIEPIYKTLSRIPSQDISNQLIENIVRIFIKCDSFPDLILSVEPESLAESINALSLVRWKVNYYASPEYYIYLISLMPVQKRTNEVVLKLTEFINSHGQQSKSMLRAFEIFKKIPIEKRDVETLEQIMLFTETEESSKQVMSIGANDLAWSLNAAAYLVTTHCIEHLDHRIELLNQVTVNPYDAKKLARTLYAFESVKLANLLISIPEELDQFDQLLRSFIPEIELYIKYFNDKTLIYFLKYEKEIEEISEKRFRGLELSDKIYLLITMKPEQVKRLLLEDEIQTLLSEPVTFEGVTYTTMEALTTQNAYFKCSLGLFCVIIMKHPEALYHLLPRLKSNQFFFFFRFLDSSLFSKHIEMCLEDYSNLMAKAEQLSLKCQAGTDVTDELIEVQSLSQTLYLRVEILKTEIDTRKLNLEVPLGSQLKALNGLIMQCTLNNQDNIPKEFLDAITFEKMKDPVKLPKPDNTYVDRSTLLDPNYFKVKDKFGVIYRQNPLDTFYYPDYTDPKFERVGPGYELDEELHQKIHAGKTE